MVGAHNPISEKNYYKIWRSFLDIQQSWPIVKIAINSNSSERPLSNSLEVSLAKAIPIAIVPKIVNSNSTVSAVERCLKRNIYLRNASSFNLECIWDQKVYFETRKTAFQASTVKQ